MVPSLLRRAVDASLEVAVVPSFSRVGIRVRRGLHGWDEATPGALTGRTVVVTGGTSGLGAEIARGVARVGATAIVVGRDEDRGRQVVDSISAEEGSARFERADLSDLAAVRSLADRLRAGDDRIHALIHNAGALLDRRTVTDAGLEVTWATMVVAPHLLSRLLADHVDRAIWMSSGGMYLQAVDLDDWSWSERPWNGSRAYAQAKRAQVDLVREATERGEAPTSFAMHPGWADTPGVDAALPGFRKVMGPILRTAAEGADTAVWLAAAPADSLEPGAFYLDRRPRGTVRWPGTATSSADRRRLRALVDEQAGRQ